MLIQSDIFTEVYDDFLFPIINQSELTVRLEVCLSGNVLNEPYWGNIGCVCLMNGGKNNVGLGGND